MLCPLCNKKLTEQQNDLFICPRGHGTLVTGKYLSDIEAKPVPAEHAPKVSANVPQIINCPHCSTAMQKVDYNGMAIIIDACTNCHYRWLDSGEVTKIKHYKPKINALDLLFISDMDEQIKQASQREVKEANPRLPVQGFYRAGAEVATSITGDNRVRLGAIVGQGLYGIIKGLMHSKFSRILTLATLAIFGLFFYLIFVDARKVFGF